MPLDDFLAFLAAGVVFLTFVSLVYRMFLRKLLYEIKDWMRWLKKFQRDWEGEAAGPGRDAVAGVMERLNRIDGELANNGGNSLKDRVMDNAAATTIKLSDIDGRVNKIESELSLITNALSNKT